MNPKEKLNFPTSLTCWPITKVLTSMDSVASDPTLNGSGDGIVGGFIGGGGGSSGGGGGGAGDLDWENCDWFFGTMTRLDAEKMVKSDGEDGCFLVRRSEADERILVVTILQNAFGLSTPVSDSTNDENLEASANHSPPQRQLSRRGIVRHYRVQETEDHRFYLTDREKAFYTVAELVDYHTLFSAGLATR